jgi:uncharacterized protein YhaN
MKLLRFDLQAFGPFTGKILDFSAGNHGLHVVFGPNEAGKSAALRAITAFLYGIPVKTPDNFLHDYDALRIGALLRHSNGSERYFTRRKGNKNTLLDESGTAIPEDLIAEFLDGIPHEIFVNMYGIGMDSLVKGGRDLIEGKGDLGAALFSAVSGIPEVRELLDSLEKRKEELFKAKGSAPTINRLLREYDDLKKKRREFTLPVSAWTDLEERTHESVEKREAISRRMHEKDAILNHKRRILEAYKDAGELREITSEIKDMTGVPKLTEDFTSRRERAEEKLSTAKETLSNDTLSLKTVKEEMSTFLVPKDLLAQRSRITSLFQDSGNYKQANEQLPRLKGNVMELERGARRIIRDLNLSDAGIDFAKYCLSVQVRAGIETLCEKYNTLVMNLDHQNAALARTNAGLKDLKEKLDALPLPCDLSDLDVLLSEYRQSGLTERLIKNLEAEVKLLESTSSERRIQLGLSDLSVEKLLSLTVPGKQTLARYAKDFQELDQQFADVHRQDEGEVQTLSRIGDEIRALQVQGAIPTEDDLNQSRESRDTLWREIRTSWLEGQDIPEDKWKPYAHDAAIPADAFQHMVTDADEISDRLRRESDRVAQLAQLLTNREKAERLIEELGIKAKSLQNKKAGLELQWSELWQTLGIRNKSPEEMREWLSLYDETSGICRELRTKSEDLKNKSVEISGYKRGLAVLISAAGTEIADETLTNLSRKAEELIKKEQQRHLERKQLEDRIFDADKQAAGQKEEVSDTTKHLSIWKEKWAQAIAAAHLDADSTPEQAKSVIEKFEELAVHVRDIEEKSSRTRAIESDNERFERDVEALFNLLGRKMDIIGYVAAVEQLNQEFVEGLKSFERMKALERKRRDLEKSIELQQGIIAGKETEIRDLLKEAGCTDPKQLPGQEALFAEYRRKTERAGELKRIISRSAAGMALDTFLSEIESANTDHLPQEIIDLEREIDELEKQRTGLDIEFGRLSTEREGMAGGSKASQISEEMESTLASLREATQEYVQLTLASTRMKEELDRYRQKNQGPLLSRAGDFLSRITLESLHGLAADYDDNDQPILVGLRNGSRIKVDAMSEGTCDQLYLTLRLASLEQRMKQREPMPLILDDVLVNFDDSRAKQALQVLAEISSQTQIILFTHHKHLCDLASQHIDKDLLYIQEL